MLGRTLAHYEVTGELGAGGMGVVYRARDRKLDREVAIKILRADGESDADLHARFQREAKILASLNHPNIANIYGLEEASGTQFLVLELVEGETLAERLNRKRVTTKDALAFSRQIAEALECAHDKGIVHRDLKPANVKLTGDGSVKVLDFGLAKSFPRTSQAVSAEGSTATVTVAVTEPHVVMGTAPYMSPEQVRGEALDPRTDVWSFGCVLYEILTNQRVIQGSTTTEIMASILMKEPDMTRLPSDVPEGITCLVRRCLQKDRRCRLQHIGDARLELEEALGIRESTRTLRAPAVNAKRWKLITAAAVVLALSSAALASWRMSQVTDVDAPATRFAVNLPAGSRIVASFNPSLALSPDGRSLFYTIPTPNTPRPFTPFIRPLDRFDAVSYESITGGVPMFSPDSKSICFIDDRTRTLRRAALNGGAPQAITQYEWINQGDWGEDGFLYWTPGVRSGIARSRIDGGETTPVTQLDTSKNEQTHRYAQLLPGGNSRACPVRS